MKWLHLGEHCYNTTYHMSIGMSPFRALYGYDAPSFVDLAFGESRAPKAKYWLQESQDILRVLKENLQVAQNQQKMYADRHRVECNFEVGDLVFLRLQPYRQSSLKRSGTEKLKPHFYGPYRVIKRVGEVAYELELPEGSRIHNVFHVSCLKKVLGQQVTTSTDLPPLDEEGQLVLTPEKIVDVRERRLRRRVIREYLVIWRGFPMEDATWEGEQIYNTLIWSCLRTTISGREDCNVPSQLIMTEDDLVAYMTPVGYSQHEKGSHGDLFSVTWVEKYYKVTLNKIINHLSIKIYF
jgi:hypothetical protein